MQKENEIRTLRAQHKQKEMILKRKQEEVASESMSFFQSIISILGTFTTSSNAFRTNA